MARSAARPEGAKAVGRTVMSGCVVWPENSSDFDPYVDKQAAADITRAVRAVGAPVLVGAILQGPGPDHRRNAGILWSPTTGPGARYIKRHPVPFAEYMPLRSLAEKISSAAKLVIKTQGDISFEASGNLDLKAQGNVTVKGSAATLEGQGSAKVKAPAVSLAGNTQFSPS